MELDRRAVLSSVAGLGAAGVAGCTGGDDGGDGEDCPSLDQEPTYGGWFEETTNYEATCDLREADTVTVDVGARGNQGFYAYSPAAVAVTTGTTIEWQWTGKGGSHDVQELNGVFDSGSPKDSDERTYERTFESPGLFKYFCSPHRSLGMRGAVFVALD